IRHERRLACRRVCSEYPVSWKRMVGNSSRSSPVSTSLGWQMTTSMPRLSCSRYQASRLWVGTLARSTPARTPSARSSFSSRAVTSVFVGIDGKHLALAAAFELPLNLLDESSFLGIDLALIQIFRFCDDEALALLGLRVVAIAVERSQAVGMVGIDQQRIEHGAQHAAIAAMLMQRRGNLFFQLLVSCFERAFEGNGNNVFPVCRKCIGDVLQRDEGACVHQVLAE